MSCINNKITFTFVNETCSVFVFMVFTTVHTIIMTGDTDQVNNGL